MKNENIKNVSLSEANKHFGKYCSFFITDHPIVVKESDLNDHCFHEEDTIKARNFIVHNSLKVVLGKYGCNDSFKKEVFLARLKMSGVSYIWRGKTVDDFSIAFKFKSEGEDCFYVFASSDNGQKLQSLFCIPKFKLIETEEFASQVKEIDKFLADNLDKNGFKI